MPPLAIAGVAAVASIGGAAISAHSSNHAATQAANTELQVAQQNNALVRENRDYLAQRLDPFVQSGVRGSDLIDSFLYGPSTASGGGAGQPGGSFQPQSFYGSVPRGIGADSWSPEGDYAPPDTGAVTTPGNARGNALGGWDAFTASPYYQFPLAEGYRGLNQQYAGIGALNSGAAVKAALKFGQNYGAGRMDEFLGLAGQQAGRGLAGASALGGVTQNALAMQTGNNQNAADATANAALLRAQNNNNLYGSIGNALGTLAGSYGSSFGKGY